jgi:hypothetical protein
MPLVDAKQTCDRTSSDGSSGKSWEFTSPFTACSTLSYLAAVDQQTAQPSAKAILLLCCCCLRVLLGCGVGDPEVRCKSAITSLTETVLCGCENVNVLQWPKKHRRGGTSQGKSSGVTRVCIFPGRHTTMERVRKTMERARKDKGTCWKRKEDDRCLACTLLF